MEFLVLGLFALTLLMCLVLKLSVLWALAAGLLLFLLYGRKKGIGWGELLKSALSGVRTIKNILIVFLLIGMLTALWRAAGTVPVIVCYASRLIHPSVFLLMSFLLNCLVSVLTGTAFGTAATMGVICAAIGSAMGVNPIFTGGAVLSGIFFGDRCSPVSTSALLVAQLTGTDIFDNIRLMLRSAAIPFALSCAAYLLLGLFSKSQAQPPELFSLFGRAFRLEAIALIPAALILLLAAFKVNVKLAMGLSILSALPLCIFLQGMPLSQLPGLLIFGYSSADSEIAPLMNGGGIISMLRVAAIVCLSSSYSGIFQKTGLLEKPQKFLLGLAEKASPFAAVLLTSLITAMISCNQTLAIMLTEQLCRSVDSEPRELALHLEDSAVVVSPLFPWSIACAVPLQAVGAPPAAVGFAFFIILLPLRGLIRDSIRVHRSGRKKDCRSEPEV
ncbi:MAG: Na+/H+ antiporter NhaC family protein [Candidatus Limivicinus sp.]|jgi:NhaC family Na+:H+ antiporter